MKRKMATMLAITMLASTSTPAINVFANDKVGEVIKSLNEEISVSKFGILNNKDLKEYDQSYKVKIKSISNNGGNYGSSTILKATDGDLKTHWETGKPNKDNFINEVTIELEQKEVIDRIVYGSRQDSAKGKGFATNLEVYAVTDENENNYTLVGNGKHSATGEIMEYKFDSVKTNKFKLVFKEAHQGWASASEFWLYKEDKIINEMSKIFTNSSKNEINPKYNTVEKLSALEEEAKNHPMYNQYKSDFEDAKILLEDGEVESTLATTRKFTLYENKEYNDLFKMDNSNIKSIKNNAGAYAGQVIDHSIDGNLKTYWETNKSNNENWNNEVEFIFDKVTTLDRVVYGARPSDNKGFANEFEIYGSKASSGDTYKLIAMGKSDTISGLMEAKFEPTEFKRLKFKFKKSNQNWATASEFAFYSEDKLTNTVNNIFSDGTHIALKPEFDLNALEELESAASKHPLKNDLNEVLEEAKEVLKNPGQNQHKVWELPARGDSIKESQKRKVWNFQDWQPTGYVVKPGDVIEVYVDGEPGKPMPQLVYKQMDVQNNGNTYLPLSPGKNVITIPETYTSNRRPGVVSGGPLYTINQATPEEQGKTPKIRIEGADRYPHFIKGHSSDEQVLADLEEYVARMKKDPTLPDVFEVFSDKHLSNLRATYALDHAKKNPYWKPSKTADEWDKTLRTVMDYWGFDESKEVHSDFNFRYMTMLKYLDGGGFMNAANGITGINQKEQGVMLTADKGWGNLHEIGHNFDTRNRDIIETTNNMLPQWYMYLQGKPSRITNQNLWESSILPKVSKEDYSKNIWYPEDSRSNLQHLAPLWQLQIYDTEFWPKFEQRFREINFNNGDIAPMQNAWLAVASDVMKLDLSEHFERHGMKPHADTKKYTSKYKKPDKPLWYVNDKIYADNAYAKFTDELNYSVVSSKINDNQAKLTISMDDKNIKNTLGYEIYRDGKLIGFTAENTFVDKEIKLGINHEYKVVAFDKTVTSKGEATSKLFTPKINAEEGVTVKLNANFDPKQYISASTYNGDNINSKVKVVSNNVDTSNRGVYEVTYEVEDEGVIAKDTMTVNVVSVLDYLSDINHVSAKVGSGSFQKDKAPNGSSIDLVRGNEIIEYKKGLGAHANSEVIYDIEAKGYEYFEAYTGIDKSANTEKSSVTFEVYVDGKKVYNSNKVNGADEHGYVKVDVKGAKELKLVTTDAGANGNYYDHSVWADAKLVKNNSAPKIILDRDVSTKVGQPIENVIGNIVATDAEDGDISSKVIVKGEDKINFNKTGTYELTYTVSDSDGNTTSKVRTVSVVNMEDAEYLTDRDWKKEEHSYTAPKKDTNIAGNPLTLTDEDSNAVVHSRGIGAHSTTNIYYDLTDKNYSYFTANVGVERAMYGKVGSVGFEVYGDGVKLYDSGKMLSKDPQKYIEVDISGVKELKLVVNDGGNGIGSDHAGWGDAKLHFATNRDNKPELKIDKSISTKVGQPIKDIIGNIVAIDAEDGDISSQVVVEGLDKIDFNKPGEYKLVYTVTDSDKNVVSSERTIAVVDMQDFSYLTDYDWNSAEQSFKAPSKNSTMSGGKIALTDENGEEVTYKKGIGAHSISTIVYDLSDKNYDYFTSYVGVNRSSYGSKGSVGFEVYGDGIKLYDSGRMSSTDSQKFVEVDINGVKELKLVINNGGDTNEGDHSSWADAKLHFANSSREYTDFSELENILETTKELEGHIYETNTWTLLENNKNKGNIVLENKESTQEEVDNTVIDLKEAIKNLEISKGKEALKATLDIANTKKEEEHTSRGWKTFEVAREKGQEIYNELGFSEAQLENFNMSLTIYMGQLTLK